MGTLEGFVGNMLSAEIAGSISELIQRQEELQRILVQQQDTLNNLLSNLSKKKYEYVVLDILENDEKKKFFNLYGRTWDYEDLSDAFEYLGVQGYAFVATLKNTGLEELVFQRMTLSPQLSTGNKFAVIEQERREKERTRAKEREQAEAMGRTTMDNLFKDAGFHPSRESNDHILYQYPNSPIEIRAMKISNGIEFQYNGATLQYDMASEKLTLQQSGEEIPSLKEWMHT